MEIRERNRKARFAGILYVLLILSGLLYLVYIPTVLLDYQSPTKTLENIKASEFLFRMGIVTAICSSIIFMLLSFALYNLLQNVAVVPAKIMVLFVWVSIPISLVNILNECKVLTLIDNPVYSTTLGKFDLQMQVMFHLESYYQGIQLSQIFWGLWLLPFGYLVFRSGFLPKLLGIFLMLGCFGYLVKFFGDFLYPNFNKISGYAILEIPAAIGEIGIGLWLLIIGTNKLGFWYKIENGISRLYTNRG